MASFNKVILLGNLTRDPEVRYTPKGSAVCDLGLAVNRNYTLDNGEKREEVTFVDVVLWAHPPNPLRTRTRFHFELQRSLEQIFVGEAVGFPWDDNVVPYS